ncbi:MAG: hypothetical protein QG567_84 [Campylobacterota bacterium]|nr:hypothetical protein [Campylobacterota bacterium]
MLKKLFKVWFWAIVIIVLVGCAEKKEVINIVIPSPPNEPRMFLEAVYYGDANFKEKSFIDNALGELADISGYNLAKPYGVTANGDSIYVADTAYHAVFDINEKLKKVSLIGKGSDGVLDLPIDLATDDENNLYVSDAKQARVLVYNKDGRFIRVIGEKGVYNKPTGIAINSVSNKIYVVDTKDHNVKVFTLDGKKLFSFGKRGTGEGEFNYPTNVAVDRRNENIVIVDTQNFRVQVFDKDGKFIRKFGKIGDGLGMFARPKGVGIDSDGNIYVADAAFNNIQVFNDAGELLTYFGGTGRKAGEYTLITGIYIDKNDRIYVVDSFNRRVQVYQYFTEIWKKNNPVKYKELIKNY